MNNGKKEDYIPFKAPKDPRERAVWLRRWIQTVFKVYGSVMDQAAVAMPEKKIEKIVFEVDAAKIEVLNLINPEQWEKEDESGQS